jgi:amidohydrolase
MSEAALRSDLVALSRAIHGTPELAYQERAAVKNIAALLEKHGHRVERNVGGVETAFRARIGPPGPAVALLAEYDALPEIGHACGHNLIAMSNVGAFLIAADRLKDLKIGIELVGTPAEESGGGKIDLLDAGAFRDAVAVLSSHPSSDPHFECGASSLGVVAKRVRFHGVAAHAAFSPHLGRNALSAAIGLFVAIDGWRQHLPADTRVHGIITKGGAAQNIIPDLAECEIGLRAPTVPQLDEMQRAFDDMARGAAMQTGTTVEIADSMRLYAPVKPNAVVSDLLVAELARRGKPIVRGRFVLASTDFGNVSQAAPADYLAFPVTRTTIPGHSHQMRDASATDLAHENAMVTAAVLAAAAVRIATDGALRERLR